MTKRLLLVAATLLATATAAYASSGVLSHPTGNHVSCKDFGYAANGVFADKGDGNYNGTYSRDHAGNETGFSVTISNYVAGSGSVNASFDYTSTGRVLAVFVKAGNGPQNLYTYPAPGVLSDTFLESPKPTISHVLFCVQVCTTAVRQHGLWRTGSTVWYRP